MATSIDYPAELPCPITEGNRMNGGSTFYRSKFDFATRQRPGIDEDYILSFNFVAPTKEKMVAFKTFYYTTLNSGALSFNATWEVEGSVVSKEFRFSKRYSSSSMGAGLYSIAAEFELMTPIEDL